MHKAYLGLALATAAALSACGQSSEQSAAVTGTVSLKNASQAEVAKQVAAANGGGAMFTPGQWAGMVKIVDLKLEGAGMDSLPPQVMEQMKKRMAQGHEFSNCLTPDEAKNARDAIAKGQQGDCTYEHFTMAGGTIDAAMTCRAGGALRKMTMTGSYTQTSYHLAMAANGSGSGPAGMSMKMEMDARRTGACTGKEDDKGGSGE